MFHYTRDSLPVVALEQVCRLVRIKSSRQQLSLIVLVAIYSPVSFAAIHPTGWADELA